MTDPVRQTGTRVAYQNPWLSVREDEIVYADGSTGIYSVIEKRDFALVLAYENEGFWLVEQFRYALRRREWEFPQGGWPAGSNGTATELAEAELREETGFRAGRLEQLGRLNAAPGYSNQRFDVFLATELEPGPSHREHSEADMVHRFFREDDVLAMIADGTFRDANGIAALTLLAIHRSRH